MRFEKFHTARVTFDFNKSNDILLVRVIFSKDKNVKKKGGVGGVL